MDYLWLSICIPTCNRPQIIDKLLESIYCQNIHFSLFEVCISDNSNNDDTSLIIEKWIKKYPNLYYQKSNSEGFYNSVEALKMGKGKYLKLHNDYSILCEKSIGKMIDSIKRAYEKQAYIYFSLGSIKSDRLLRTFNSYNDFSYFISYYATWSSSFGIWKDKFDSINKAGITPNYMYPHTSYLHKIVDEGKYIVDNEKYADSITPPKKGGYNLVDNFVRIYLTMVREDLFEKGSINKKTYKKIENGIIHFCAQWFYLTMMNPDKFTFSFDNDEDIIESICSKKGVYKYRIEKKKEEIKQYIIIIKNRVMGLKNE